MSSYFILLLHFFAKESGSLQSRARIIYVFYVKSQRISEIARKTSLTDRTRGGLMRDNHTQAQNSP
jgi:hypothetical protein